VLSRVADALEPGLPAERQVEWFQGLADRAAAAREYAHRVLAAERTPEQLAAGTQQRLMTVVDSEATVSDVTLRVYLPARLGGHGRAGHRRVSAA
jgi:hypothetical protein